VATNGVVLARGIPKDGVQRVAGALDHAFTRQSPPRSGRAARRPSLRIFTQPGFWLSAPPCTLTG